MSQPPRWAVRLTGPARRDIAALLAWSRQAFGPGAAERYEALLVQALQDIGDDPERPGSQARPDLLIEGARTYPLQFSRSRVTGPGVKAPRHFLLYRYREGVVEVARVLHDRRDLPRHVPEEYHRE